MDEDEKIGKWLRVTGTDREALKIKVRSMYVDTEMSIREISESTGRSYGAVHKLLLDSGTTLRPRGNPKL